MAALRARATASETGESPFAVLIQTSAHAFNGDEPIEAGGGGLGPAPFELLSAALAECTAMTVRWYARQQNWPVDTVEVAVEYSKKQFAGSPAPVDVFEKTISIRGPQLSKDQRAKLLEVAAKCPVHRTLEGGATILSLVGASIEPVAG